MAYVPRLDIVTSDLRLHHGVIWKRHCTLLSRAVARVLIGGGGGGVSLFIYSCSARLISFEINLKTADFKRNPSDITR